MLIVLLLSNLLAPFVALGVFLSFLFSARRGVLKELPSELTERLGGVTDGLLARLGSAKPRVWIHCASAGEVAAAETLVRRLREGGAAVVMTTTTRAGRAAALRSGAADACLIAPLDCWPAVARFLTAVKPRALILVETELWPNMIALASRSGARLALVNGRLSERSFGRYRLFAPLIRPFLSRFERLAVQTDADASRFEALGAPRDRVAVAGNMKFDRIATAGSAVARERIEAMDWSGHPIFVAGSTHPGEEEALIDAFLRARPYGPRLVLAPRHSERAADAAATLKKLGVSFRRWSEPPAGADCLLLDVLGVLPSFYGLAAVSFVGGTLVPVGGHNVLEPALAGSPVLFGPHYAHTRQAAELLVSAGCGFVVSDAAELSAKLSDMLAEPARTAAQGRQALALARGLQGATERTFAHLEPLLRT